MTLNFVGKMKEKAAKTEPSMVLTIPGPLNAAQYQKLEEAIKAGAPQPLEPIKHPDPAGVLDDAFGSWTTHEQIHTALRLLSMAGLKPTKLDIEVDNAVSDHHWIGASVPAHVINHQTITAEIDFTIMAQNAHHVAAILEQTVSGNHW